DHLVERRPLGPAARAIADPELDIGDAQTAQALTRLLRELPDELDAVYVSRQRGDDGRLIPEAGPDFEHRVLRLDIEQIGHQRDDEGLRDRLVEADRQRRI